MFSQHRARIMGTRHMVAAGHYLASQAAFQILEAGGNAVDAACAGGIALGVLQSEYVGFGGVAPILVHMSDQSAPVTIAGLGHWPAATDPDVFLKEYAGVMPKGLLRTVVPAAPDAWITALERFGTMSYSEVAQAALRFAKEGFPAASIQTAIIGKAQKDYERWNANADIFLPGGKPPQPGDLFVQSDLGRTITYMIDEEKTAAAKGGRQAGLQAARDAFYKGDIAQAMVKFHRENGGWLREADLAGYHSEVETAMKTRFMGADFYFCGPWCQGPMLGQTLAMLDGTDLTALNRHNSADYIHFLIEALKLSYADRHNYFGDPRFVDVPLDRLMDPEYLRDRKSTIDMSHAQPGMPDPGDIEGYGRVPVLPGEDPDFAGQLDTSYICVIDSHGNTVSATPSDGSAASQIIPGLGFAPSSRGSQSWTDPRMPAAVAPGKRPRLTPNPGLLVKKGEWVMPIGSPGNDVQPQAMLQVMLNKLVWGMNLQDAIDQPRFATFSFPRSSSPHNYDPGLVCYENRLPEETIADLRQRGHQTKAWPEWDYLAGGVCAIHSDLQRGILEGGSDPRRPTGVNGL
jgi:gamma-glutamyltranspeptidase/glutathione hydrolase